MPAGRDQRRAARLSEGLRGLLDMGAGALKGGVQALIGLPGDLEEWRRDVGGSESARVLPTSKEVGGYLPGTGRDTKTWESVGEQLNPVESLKPLLAAGKGAAAAKAGLYAGALRKDLLHSHNTNASQLLKGDKLPAELYNLSLGITPNRVMDFGGGNTLLVPHQGVFDPARGYPASIHGVDAYTPRHPMAEGVRADESRHDLSNYRASKNYLKDNPNDRDVELYRDEMETRANTLAGRRLVDRLVSKFPKGGAMQEGSGMGVPRLGTLPQYGKGGYNKEAGLKGTEPTMADEPMETLHTEAFAQRIPSFKTYETSPYGASRLDADAPRHSKVYDKVSRFLVERPEELEKIGYTASRYDLDELGMPSSPLTVLALKGLASTKSPRVEPESVKRAQELLRQLRQTRSDYGEIKAWGPVGLHRDNFAGIIADPKMDTLTRRLLEEAAKKRGIPFDVKSLHMGLPSLQTGLDPAFEVAKQMQGETGLVFKPRIAQARTAEPKVWTKDALSSAVMDDPHLKFTNLNMGQLEWLQKHHPEHPVLDSAPDLAILKKKMNSSKTKLSDLDDDEMEWMVEHDPGHTMFDGIED